MGKNSILIKNAQVFDPELCVLAVRDILVADGLVADIGTLDARTDVQLLDAGGNVVLKPFCDYHLHIPGAQLYDQFGVNISQASQMDAYATLIGHRTRQIEGMVRGFGWSMTVLEPYFADAKNGSPRAFLDSICDTKAIILFSNDFHNCWCNSPAVSFLTTQRVAYSDSVKRRSDGLFCGHIAKQIFDFVPLSFSDTQVRQAILSYQSELLDCGIGAVYAFMFIGIPREQALKVLKQLDDEGLLQLEVFACYDVYAGMHLDRIVCQIEKSRSFASKRIHFHFAKVYLDGVIDDHSAWLIEPYADSDTVGQCRWQEDELFSVVQFLHERNIPIHFHAIGDRAVETAVRMVQKSTKLQDGFDAIAHMQLSSVKTVQALAKEGIWACMQPFWFGDCKENPLDRLRLGARATDEYPIEWLMQSDCKLLFSSDSPVTKNPSPFLGLRCFFERTKLASPTAWAHGLKAYTKGAIQGTGYAIQKGDEADFVCYQARSLDALVGESVRVLWRVTQGEVVKTE